MDHVQRYIRRFDTIFIKLCKNCEDLDFAENRYYRINQIILSMMQLWPYDQSMLTTIKFILFLAIMLSSTFFQFTALLTYEYTIEFFINLFSVALLYVLCILQYYYFYGNLGKIKQMWKDIRHSWNCIKDEAECDIMRQYSFIGEFTTIFMIVGGLLIHTVYTLFLFSPIILDIIFPLNETRLHTIRLVMEYFVDYDKYYWPMMSHYIICSSLSVLLNIATYTFLIVYIHHICGLLQVSCYRIEQVVKGYTLSSFEKKDGDFVKKFSDAVQIHREALTYADFLTSTFVYFIMIVIGIGAATLSLNWLRFMRGIIFQNISEMSNGFMMITVHFIVFFLTNYYGQLITDHNSEICKKVYKVRWYVAPIDVQKLLLFVMKKTTRIYYLNFGGNLITASIETFAKLIRLWFSYSTIIYSLIK